MAYKRYLFFVTFLLAIVMRIPWLALLAGTGVGLAGLNIYGTSSSKYARILLSASVVIMGFSIPLTDTLSAGTEGLITTTVSVLLTMGCGVIVGKILNVPSRLTLLISAGSAICGASAIAALSKVVGAETEEITISLATIFFLNALALVVFPPLGHWLGLSEEAFGVLSGIAIHDTSSVAGAAALYGERALAIAVPVKLARALWIVPLCITAGLFTTKKKKTSSIKNWIPPFLYLFLLASAASSLLPWVSQHKAEVDVAVKILLCATLFFIGTGITWTALKTVGPKPFALGLALWVLITGSTVAMLQLP